jgi:hypothetical protein
VSSFGLVEGPASVAVGGLMHTGVMVIKRRAACFDVPQRKDPPNEVAGQPVLCTQSGAKALILNPQVGILSSNNPMPLIKKAKLQATPFEVPVENFIKLLHFR